MSPCPRIAGVPVFGSFPTFSSPRDTFGSVLAGINANFSSASRQPFSYACLSISTFLPTSARTRADIFYGLLGLSDVFRTREPRPQRVRRYRVLCPQDEESVRYHLDARLLLRRGGVFLCFGVCWGRG